MSETVIVAFIVALFFLPIGFVIGFHLGGKHYRRKLSKWEREYCHEMMEFMNKHEFNPRKENTVISAQEIRQTSQNGHS